MMASLKIILRNGDFFKGSKVKKICLKKLFVNLSIKAPNVEKFLYRKRLANISRKSIQLHFYDYYVLRKQLNVIFQSVVSYGVIVLSKKVRFCQVG